MQGVEADAGRGVEAGGELLQLPRGRGAVDDIGVVVGDVEGRPAGPRPDRRGLERPLTWTERLPSRVIRSTVPADQLDTCTQDRPGRRPDRLATRSRCTSACRPPRLRGRARHRPAAGVTALPVGGPVGGPEDTEDPGVRDAPARPASSSLLQAATEGSSRPPTRSCGRSKGRMTTSWGEWRSAPTDNVRVGAHFIASADRTAGRLNAPCCVRSRSRTRPCSRSSRR